MRILLFANDFPVNTPRNLLWRPIQRRYERLVGRLVGQVYPFGVRDCLLQILSGVAEDMGIHVVPPLVIFRLRQLEDVNLIPKVFVLVNKPE